MISETGGSTTAEFLTSGVPVAMSTDSHRGIPHERMNAILLEKRGLGFRLKPGTDTENLISVLKPALAKELTVAAPVANHFESRLPEELFYSLSAVR